MVLKLGVHATFKLCLSAACEGVPHGTIEALILHLVHAYVPKSKLQDIYCIPPFSLANPTLRDTRVQD